MIDIKKILFPVDLRETASNVLPLVLSFAEKYGSTVYLIHVVQDLQKWGKLYIPHASVDRFQKEAEQGAEKSLEEFCRSELNRCPGFIKKITSGDPAEEILKFIAEEGIDLVIIGTSGRKGLEYRIFGSVAEKVVKKSTVPVLTVRP